MTTRLILFTISFCFSICLMGQEICDNAIDDDGDGLVDLNDDDCDCETLVSSSLIPNLSFEEMTCCPRQNARLDCAVDWIQASAATSDYVHTCGGYLGNTNINAVCPLPFPDGQGGIGFRDGQQNVGPNYKEYVGACLTAPMEVGKRYRLDFFVGFQDNRPGSRTFEMAIFGARNCGDIPFGGRNATIGCPLNSGRYDLLGEQRVSGSDEWVNVVFEFEATQAYQVLVLGPGCDAHPDYLLNPYFYADRLAFEQTDSFGIPLDTITGSICQDDLILQSATDTGYTYQWYRDGVAMIGETNSTLSLGASTNDEGIYLCRITTKDGCFLSTSYPVRIPPYYQRDTVDICDTEYHVVGMDTLRTDGFHEILTSAGDGCDSIVQLTLNVSPTTQGFLQETICEGASFSFIDTLLTTGGTYNRTIANAAGCDSVLQLSLNVSPPPQGFVLDTFCIGESYDFLDTTFTTSGSFSRTISNNMGCDSIVNLSLYAFPETGNIGLPDTIRVNLGDIFDIIPTLNNLSLSNFAWTDENGVFIHDESTLRDFQAIGSGPLFLTGINSYGCQLLASTYILVKKENIRVYVPNVFTPNGDGLNDFFKHFSTTALEGIIRFSVYDRWGELVFNEAEISDASTFIGWDGFFRNENALPGVYAYLIELEFLDGSTTLLTGDVTLLR